MADLEGTPPGRLKQGEWVACVTATLGYCYTRGQLVPGGREGDSSGHVECTCAGMAQTSRRKSETARCRGRSRRSWTGARTGGAEKRGLEVSRDRRRAASVWVEEDHSERAWG